MNIGFTRPVNIGTEPVERALDLRKHLNFVWRHWMFITCVAAFSFLIGIIYLLRATPLYTATTQVLLERPRKLPALEAPACYDSRFDYSYMDSQVAIVESDSLLRRVVIKEQLARNAKESQATAATLDTP